MERPGQGTNLSAYAIVVCDVAGRYYQYCPRHSGAFEPGLMRILRYVGRCTGSGVLGLPYALKLGRNAGEDPGDKH